jgi:oligopeptide transport system permease protein
MKFLLRRLALLIPLTVLIATLAFFLLRLMPGSPFDKERPPASKEIERALKEKYHLDEPLWSQYLRFLGLRWEHQADGHWHRAPGGIIAGDLGLSLKYRNHTVADILLQGLPVSATLGALAFCFAIGIGVPVGFYGAVRRGRWPDWLGSLAAILVICVPGFVVGPLLVMGFAVKQAWFPAAMWGSPLHAVLPMVTLGLFFAGRIARLMREGMTQAMQSEFITAARAKGLSGFAVLTRHAFRIAVAPVVSYSGPMLADLLTGSFVVENIFQVPGIGVFLVNSVLGRDYTMTVGLVMLYAVMSLLMNLLVDFGYAWLDPRVRYE